MRCRISVVAMHRLTPAGLKLRCCHVERLGTSKMGGSFMRGSRLGPEGGASGDHRVSWHLMMALGYATVSTQMRSAVQLL